MGPPAEPALELSALLTSRQQCAAIYEPRRHDGATMELRPMELQRQLQASHPAIKPVRACVYTFVLNLVHIIS
jgi:hypothetical protein